MKNAIKINSKEWCEIIFKNKNKHYGAFILREKSSMRHLLAIGITFLLFVALIVISTLVSNINARSNSSEHSAGIDEVRTASHIDMQKDEIIKKLVENIPEPPVAPRANTIVFIPPIIGTDQEVDENTNPIHTVEEVIESGATISTIDFNEGVDGHVPAIEITEGNIITETESGPVDFAEVMPEYPGGEKKMYKDIAQSLRYPVDAQEAGKQGRATIRFVVRKDGSIDMTEVVRGFHPSCDREALRVISQMKRWIPGKQNGVPVDVYFTLPIVFKLQN